MDRVFADFDGFHVVGVVGGRSDLELAGNLSAVHAARFRAGLP